MSQELDFHKKEYADSVRLFLWYQESKFSFFPSHKSKTQAEHYRYMAGYHFEEIGKLTGRKSNQ